MPKEKLTKLETELKLLKGIAEHGPIHIFPFHKFGSKYFITSRGTIYRAKKDLENKGFIIIKETVKFRTGQDKKIFQLAGPIQQIYDFYGPDIFLKMTKIVMQSLDIKDKKNLESAVSFAWIAPFLTPDLFSLEEQKIISQKFSLKDKPPIVGNFLEELKRQIDNLSS